MTKKLAIIRRDEDGVDDVVIHGDLFRMERMSSDSFWVCIYRGEKAVMFSLTWDKKNRLLRASDYQDDLGCIDDVHPGLVEPQEPKRRGIRA